jgi:FlaG/FlaF family flagellin (archaellin)
MGRGVKGISEVTAVIVMILIATVAAFGIKSYIDYQSTKLPSTDIAVARYSITYGSPGIGVVTLIVSNLLPSSISVNSVTTVFSNGSTYTPPLTPQVASGKSDVQLVFTVPLQQGVTVSRILVNVTDSATGRSQVVVATGG